MSHDKRFDKYVILTEEEEIEGTLFNLVLDSGATVITLPPPEEIEGTFLNLTLGIPYEHGSKSKEAKKCQQKFKVVQYALSKGIRKAAKDFGLSRNTVKKWIKDFKSSGMPGLEKERGRPKIFLEAYKKKCEEITEILHRKEIKDFLDKPIRGLKAISKALGVAENNDTVKRCIRSCGTPVVKKNGRYETSLRLLLWWFDAVYLEANFDGTEQADDGSFWTPTLLMSVGYIPFLRIYKHKRAPLADWELKFLSRCHKVLGKAIERVKFPGICYHCGKPCDLNYNKSEKVVCQSCKAELKE